MAIKIEIAKTEQADLEKMIEAGAQEGQRIDYKKEYPTNWNDKAKHSLAADAVAFANTKGGTLIFGITQGSNAEAVQINPQQILSTDDERVKLHSFLSDLVEPSLPGIQTHAVPVAVNGVSGYVMLVHIPQSWTGPHRSKMSNQFLIRDGLKNKTLDIPEIRSLFLGSENRIQNLQNFRTERLSKVMTGDTPFKLADGSVLVVHIAPIQALLGQVSPDIVQYSGLRRKIPIVAATGGAALYKINLDGAVGARNTTAGVTHGYTVIFRNGFIESTWVQTTKNPDSTANPSLPGGSFEGHLRNFVLSLRDEINHWGAGSEILVMLSLLRADGMRLAYSRDFSGDESGIFDRDILAFPDIEMDSERSDLMQQLRPLFNMVWQAAGFNGSPNFNNSGDWVPPRQ